MNTADTRIDRLYDLLPAIHRMRDAEQGYPLKALLRVITEQVNVVEDDVNQLYQNWFIETCADWAVPYIGDLVGYRPVPDAEPAPDVDRPVPRVLVPRREVANLIRSRRRKGTLALLEELANDVGGWPARAVEFFRLLGWAQNINHQHLKRHRLADMHDVEALDLIDGPFDSTTHSVDVRRINSVRTAGRYNIPSIGVFAWRLKSYPVTQTPAFCVEEAGPNRFTFSVLGQDAPLFLKPIPEPSPTHIARELNLPVPIRRLALEKRSEDFYGENASFAIWAEGWAGFDPAQPVPRTALITADLSDWVYEAPLKHIVVDPVLGRMVFPASQLPKKGVRVSYHYGFPADLGGGEYSRTVLDAPLIGTVYNVGEHQTYKTVKDAAAQWAIDKPDTSLLQLESNDKPVDLSAFDPANGTVPQLSLLYRVGEDQVFRRIGDAIDRWTEDQPQHAIIEITTSGVYVEPINVRVGAGQYLQVRAANRVRPVIRLIDWQTDMPDAMSVAMSAGSRFVLDGIILTGRPLQVTGPDPESGDGGKSFCAAEVHIRHCTLVPGWGIDCDCEPKRPNEPSLELTNVRARVCIEHSIVGAIKVHENEVTTDPIPLYVADSIVDATDIDSIAIGPSDSGFAHVDLTIKRCTIFGIVEVRVMSLAENSIFMGCVNVSRRQLGCMRFCYVPSGCRTPRRHGCQPDGVIAAVKASFAPADQDTEIANEILRVTPQFTSMLYGTPAYAQLATACAQEIVRGADDESEMGVYHDLFQPQRAANLRARLDEFTAAGMDVALIFVN